MAVRGGANDALGSGDGRDNFAGERLAEGVVAGFAFERGSGEHGVALADMRRGLGDGLVGDAHMGAGAGAGHGRAGLSVGDEGAAQVLGEAGNMGALAPCGGELAIVDDFLGCAGIERDDGLLGCGRAGSGLSARVERRLDLAGAVGEGLPDLGRDGIQLQSTVLDGDRDGIAQTLHLGRELLVIDRADRHLERVEGLRLGAAPCAAVIAGGVKDDAVGADLRVGHLLARAGGVVREGGDDGAVGRGPLEGLAVTDAGCGRVPPGIVERDPDGAVVRVEQTPVARDQRRDGCGFTRETRQVPSRPMLALAVADDGAEHGALGQTAVQMSAKVFGSTSPRRSSFAALRPMPCGGSLDVADKSRPPRNSRARRQN